MRHGIGRLELRDPPQRVDAYVRSTGHQLGFAESQQDLRLWRAEDERPFELGGRYFEMARFVCLPAALEYRLALGWLLSNQAAAAEQ